MPQCLDCSILLKDPRSKRCRHCANTGEKHPNYGKHLSLEHRKKMSLANRGNKKCAYWTGRKMPKEHVEAISKAHQKRVLMGKSHLYKDGKYTREHFEKIVFKKTIRKEVLKRDNYTCQLCGNKKDLQVDHIQPWAEYVELRFNIDNCRTLCMGCHYELTFGKPIPINVKTFGTTLKNLERRVNKYS